MKKAPGSKLEMWCSSVILRKRVSEEGSRIIGRGGEERRGSNQPYVALPNPHGR